MLRKTLFFCCLALKCFLGLSPAPPFPPLPGIAVVRVDDCVKEYITNQKEKQRWDRTDIKKTKQQQQQQQQKNDYVLALPQKGIGG